MASAPAFSVALLLLVSVAGVRAVPQGGTSTCSTDLFRLLPCLPFIEGTSAVPADTCCANLGSMVHDEPQCLCQALSNPSTAPVAVNMTRVMAMPRLCRLDLPPATGACAGKVLPFQPRVQGFRTLKKSVFHDDPFCSCRSSSPWTITTAAITSGHSTPKRQLHCSSDPHAGDANAEDTTYGTVTVGEQPNATIQQGVKGDN
ncbi:unnamed protein product [Miscanthus lutarioriparius]|uniref:Bifunctional inhibitor/plant lipid transfer protein/seed storage helical domain-containing protein n=1 Tax=Miscanthus lutarioriparius TaxID=422564 RepID=A0A811R2B8_9POAL|nr:unnamed protein product [Miscanthus lutarioriparius]